MIWKDPLSSVVLLVGCLVATGSGAVDVVVHRGDNGNAPENTLASAKRCIEMGVEYVEIDVRRSKDGVHYILHDRTVDRTTDGAGEISELTSETIDGLDAGSWFSQDFAGEPVPRLEPYVAEVKDRIKIYFDVKDADLAYLVDLVERYELEDRCFFWFGNRSMARAFRRLAPDLGLKVNAVSIRAARRAYEEVGATIVECPVEALLPGFVDFCRRVNLRIMVREGEPDAEAFRKTIEAGADLINLDHPALFMQIERDVLSGK